MNLLFSLSFSEHKLCLKGINNVKQKYEEAEKKAYAVNASRTT